jgi:hypothetical protein
MDWAVLVLDALVFIGVWVNTAINIILFTRGKKQCIQTT